MIDPLASTYVAAINIHVGVGISSGNVRFPLWLGIHYDFRTNTPAASPIKKVNKLFRRRQKILLY